ncbi:hypothetical protein [Alcanivorax quisquiliarum]|uniref:Uncharacterized protein n=1 Tax=Alcanivorax quisquiliarum TaxID=2933565 RepID=A0ABT0E679_9GAMM|nr:hypothetical protein [Alcanivorax quisquiliarum]MCK0537132.1 hypothetical protein [Alcanivorax quisquiliarum]
MKNAPSRKAQGAKNERRADVRPHHSKILIFLVFCVLPYLAGFSIAQVQIELSTPVVQERAK